MKDQHVLITGASKGIGLELAHQFAKHGYSIILTATNETELAEAAVAIGRDFEVTARVIAADLLDPTVPRQLHELLQREGVTIDILVNNAGLGHHGWFVNRPITDDVETIRVNVEALVRMTKAFLPGMVSRHAGRILNIASVGGFAPAPEMAVYHATKAFVLSFSEALSEEVKDTGVSITALCPGPTDTEFYLRAEAVDTAGFQKMPVMSPQEVARNGYDALMLGERVHIAGGLNKATMFMSRLLPNTFMVKLMKHFYADTQPERRKRKSGALASKATRSCAI